MKRLLIGSIPVHATRILVALGATLIFMLAGCKKDDAITEPTPPPQKAYVLDTTLAILPLKVGNSSSFRELTLSSTGSTTLTKSWGPFFVTKDSVVGNNTWFFDRGFNGWFWNGPGGVWLKFPMLVPGFDTTSNLLLKWPCKKGDTYNTRLVAAGDLDVQATVTAIDEIVTVPAVTETCVVYEFRNAGQLVARMYLAPGIGWLREDDYFTNSSMTTLAVLPLTSYVHFRYETTGFTRN